MVLIVSCGLALEIEFLSDCRSLTASTVSAQVITSGLVSRWNNLASGRFWNINEILAIL